MYYCTAFFIHIPPGTSFLKAHIKVLNEFRNTKCCFSQWSFLRTKTQRTFHKGSPPLLRTLLCISFRCGVWIYPALFTLHSSLYFFPWCSVLFFFHPHLSSSPIPPAPKLRRAGKGEESRRGVSLSRAGI